MSRSRAEAVRAQRRAATRDNGWHTARGSIVLGYLAHETYLYQEESLTGADSWATVNSRGSIVANKLRDGEPAEWAWAFAHLMLHLGLDHLAESRLAEAHAILPSGESDEPGPG